MSDSVDEDSDLISLERLSFSQASCFNRHCHCNQKQPKCGSSHCSDRSNLSWPPRQTRGVSKPSRRQTSALNIGAVTNCLTGKKRLSSQFAAAPRSEGVQEEFVWGRRTGITANFGDLARLADTDDASSRCRGTCADFTSTAFQNLGRRRTDFPAVRLGRKSAAKRKTDIVLTDLKSALPSEGDNLQTCDLQTCDSSSKTASSSSDVLQSGHLSLPCSQQALTSDCLMDEVDELTGYFEHYFHIPKKMSEMAKMMYA